VHRRKTDFILPDTNGNPNIRGSLS